MNRPAWRQVAVQAWGFRPSWTDNIALVALGSALVVFYDVPWWVVIAGYALGCPLVCGVLGWLQCVNELDEAAYRPPQMRDEGEPQ